MGTGFRTRSCANKRPSSGGLPRQFGADKTKSDRGRVAQRKSTSLTWRGSQVRSLSRPPFRYRRDVRSKRKNRRAEQPRQPDRRREEQAERQPGRRVDRAPADDVQPPVK